MENPLKVFNAFVLLSVMLLAWPQAVQAQTRQKKFSKTYAVSPGAELSVNNQFGNVVIHSWGKNQVKADVSILVEHGNESKAQQLLSAIEIIEEAGGNHISLRTSVGSKINLKGNSSMQINYEIYMPATVNLELVNKFGNTTLPDLKGSTEVRQSFGNLETGSLGGTENSLFVEFSEGSTRIGSVKNLEGDFSFSNISISGLTGQAEIDAQHCGTFELGAQAALTSLDLDVQYSEVAIDLAGDFSGKFDVSTNFGDFRYNDRVSLAQAAENDTDRGPKFKFEYTGKIGQGGKPLLTIDSSFSTITFR